MKRTFIIVSLFLSATSLWAGDVGLNITIGVPGFYLSVGHFFGYPEREVIVVHERGIPDDELPVVFFVCHHAHVAPEVVIHLRVISGWSWARICEYYRIHPMVFFIPVRSYGPPYGHAFGHYRHHPHRGDWERIRMTDDMIVNQVNLIFISKYYNYPPERVIRMREIGSSFPTIERRVYREREYQARLGVPPEGRSAIPMNTRKAGPPPPEEQDPDRWREIPSQGVRPPEARFRDVYSSISDPSQRPDVKGKYHHAKERGKGRGQGKKDKRGRD